MIRKHFLEMTRGQNPLIANRARLIEAHDHWADKIDPMQGEKDVDLSNAAPIAGVVSPMIGRLAVLAVVAGSHFKIVLKAVGKAADLFSAGRAAADFLMTGHQSALALARTALPEIAPSDPLAQALVGLSRIGHRVAVKAEDLSSADPAAVEASRHRGARSAIDPPRMIGLKVGVKAAALFSVGPTAAVPADRLLIDLRAARRVEVVEDSPMTGRLGEMALRVVLVQVQAPGAMDLLAVIVPRLGTANHFVNRFAAVHVSRDLRISIPKTTHVSNRTS